MCEKLKKDMECSPDDVTAKDVYDRLWASRDFEIKLVWERAVFLTAFLIACFAGYGGFVLSVHQNGCGNLDPFCVRCIPIGISLVGVVLSSLWIMMAKGSKAWYEHYECALIAFAKQINLKGIDSGIVGGDWRRIKDVKRNAINDKLIRGCDGGAYSVSKIVILLGKIFLCVWSFLLIVHIFIARFGTLQSGLKAFGNICNLGRYLQLKNAWVLIPIFTVVLVFWISRMVKSGYLKSLVYFLPEDESRGDKCYAVKCPKFRVGMDDDSLKNLIKDKISGAKDDQLILVVKSSRCVRVFTKKNDKIENASVDCVLAYIGKRSRAE